VEFQTKTSSIKSLRFTSLQLGTDFVIADIAYSLLPRNGRHFGKPLSVQTLTKRRFAAVTEISGLDDEGKDTSTSVGLLGASRLKKKVK
jgi:hypothetical protein